MANQTAEEKKQAAINKAESVFFASIAKSYPEVKNGDINPLIYAKFQQAVTEIVEDFISNA